MLKKVIAAIILIFLIPLCEGLNIRESAKTVIKAPVFILALPVNFLLYTILALLHVPSYLFSILVFLVNTFVSYIPERLIDVYSGMPEEFAEGARNWGKVITWYFPFFNPLKPFLEVFNFQIFMSLPFIGPIFSIVPLIFQFIGGMISIINTFTRPIRILEP